MPRIKTPPKTCYCCDAVADTRDHIPPICFFPERKYLSSDSPNYRTNLLTVPSCKKHNNGRSSDDEYTLVAILTGIHNSEIAEDIFKTKIMRALFRQNSALARKVFKNIRPVKVQERVGNLIMPPYETAANSFERDIIDNVIKSIARGIYYHESKGKNKWIGECMVESPNFRMSNLSLNPNYKNFITLSQMFDVLGIQRKGSHSEIFYYQFYEHPEEGPAIKMVFYNYFIFFVFFNAQVVSDRSPLIIL